MSISSSETRRFAQIASARTARARRAREVITRAVGLTSSGLALAVMAVAAWLVGFVVAGKTLYLVSYACLFFLGVSWALGRRQPALHGERGAARPRVAEGEVLDMHVELTASRRVNTLILEEQLPALLGRPATTAIANIEQGESVEHGYRVACWRRGAFNLGPLVARWGDPFGLTQREMVLQDPFELLVHPSVELVADRPLTRLFEDPPIRPPVSKPWPTGLEFYGMREYEPGDDPRSIVWRAYARTYKLLVRESEQGITDRITVMLDTDRRYHSRGLVSESFETAVRTAASIGVAHVREGYAVTVEGNGKRLAGPLRGHPAQMELLDSLARAELEREPLTEAIARQLADASRNVHVVLITPRLDPDATGRLRLLLDRGVSVLVGALLWDDDAYFTLGQAVALGCQVTEIRPGAPLQSAFPRDVAVKRS